MNARLSLALSVPHDKIARYLLDMSHPDGAPKARFFIKHGFDPEDASEFAVALAAHGSRGWPGTLQRSPFGIKHRISGPMVMPDGTIHMIRTVWQEIGGPTQATLVTAVPKA